MRFLPVIFVAVGVGAVFGQTPRPLHPPVIHEGFTPLQCPPHPGTTIALEGCAEKAILRTDGAINARVRRIFGLLRSRSAKASFVRSEEAWLRYRRGSCSAEASAYAGGSAEPLVFAECVVHRNRSHLADLAETQRTLGPH